MHDAMKSPKVTILARLAGISLLHKFIRILRVQKFVALILTVLPIKRRLKQSGCEYRIRFLESILMADEIFTREVYRTAFENRTIRTFIDIGANVGYFTLYAAERIGNRTFTALAIDADARMADEVRWHVATNQLTGTQVRTGVAGYPPEIKAATFYVNPPNVASSAQPILNPNVPSKGDSVAVTVPAVDVGAEWKAIARGQRIDLLKVDIEGFELEFIRNSTELLSLTNRIVLEWHKWVTSLDEVDVLLGQHGFARTAIVTQDQHTGVAVFDHAHR
jgi:FkbM family methyltransferase